MRARITLAVFLVLAGALLLAGVVSFSLVRRAAGRSAEAALLHQAEVVASRPSVVVQTGVYGLLAAATGTKVSALELTPTGQVRSVQPPLQVPASILGGKALVAGHPRSGLHGGFAYAVVVLKAIPADLQGAGNPAITLALALQSKVTAPADSVGYFALAGGISLLVAALVVAVIARRISRRVLAASAAARQIAEGDLSARIPTGASVYPELAGLDDAINTMAENLARARNLERQFLLSISHDLRTPLTSIRGYSEAIRDGAVGQPGQAAQVVVAEADRLERLIGDLLDLAKLEARQFSLREVRCDLAETVTAGAEALRFALEQVDVGLELRVPGEPLTALADPDRLRQVLANLMENALKFADAKVTVALAVTGEGRAVLSVEDDGPGIAPEDLPYVFERLFSSGRHEARAAGSGLGLAIVAELAQAMGGSVVATSPLGPGGGTRITVDLPLRRPPGP